MMKCADLLDIEYASTLSGPHRKCPFAITCDNQPLEFWHGSKLWAMWPQCHLCGQLWLPREVVLLHVVSCLGTTEIAYNTRYKLEVYNSNTTSCCCCCCCCCCYCCCCCGECVPRIWAHSHECILWTKSETNSHSQVYNLGTIEWSPMTSTDLKTVGLHCLR